MKRTWKNFKLDKNKVYMRIGQAVAYTSLWILAVVGTTWALTRTVIY